MTPPKTREAKVMVPVRQVVDGVVEEIAVEALAYHGGVALVDKDLGNDNAK